MSSRCEATNGTVRVQLHQFRHFNHPVPQVLSSLTPRYFTSTVIRPSLATLPVMTEVSSKRKHPTKCVVCVRHYDTLEAVLHVKRNLGCTVNTFLASWNNGVRGGYNRPSHINVSLSFSRRCSSNLGMWPVMWSRPHNFAGR